MPLAPTPDDIAAARRALVAADPALDADTVLALFADRLARFKHPKDVIFCQSLPRNAMGKIEKFTLRERYGA